jgi:hypothetical protein
MGSSGTGHFTDYTQRPPTQGGGGGADGDDICLHAFESDVEEVGTAEYNHTYGAVPHKGTPVRVEARGRPAIVTDRGVVVGYLPTKFNYLISCMKSGHQYSGAVAQSSNKPIPNVFVSIMPVAK